MLIPMMRGRIKTAVAGTPDTLEALLAGIESTDPIWDKRPDPERFTLREILAHLADYDLMWPARLSRTLAEDNPTHVPANPGQMAIDNNYAAIDPRVSLATIRDRRAGLVALLHDTNEDLWQRTARWGEMGTVTFEEQAAVVVIHDSYHTSQIAQWLRILS